MPYIKQEKREAVKTEGAKDPGELNYILTFEIQEWLKQSDKISYNGHVHEIGVALERLIELYGPIKMPFSSQSTIEANLYTRILISDLVDCRDDVRAVLRWCQSEFYRRVAVPFEDQKIKENGDVYE